MQSWRGTTNVNVTNSSKNMLAQIRWGMLQGALLTTMIVLSIIGISCLMQQNQQK